MLTPGLGLVLSACNGVQLEYPTFVKNENPLN